MKTLFYFLKYKNQYLRSNNGFDSIHLVSHLLEADRFRSKESANNFLQSLNTNPDLYMIDPAIELNNVKIVSEFINV